ncbi:MAG: hypothetical protein QOI57_2980 [Rubrobacteraceae bacterium]|nr:hypothetical protein [Rubrobacteraceae bacterium]
MMLPPIPTLAVTPTELLASSRQPAVELLESDTLTPTWGWSVGDSPRDEMAGGA